MNADQGSHVTSFDWTDRLTRANAKFSMNGKGRSLDNIFIEHLWRSLKYECVYLHAWETGSQAKTSVGRRITFYNHQRPHAAHKPGLPAKIEADAELKTFILARINRRIFGDIVTELQAVFPPDRQVSRSGLLRLVAENRAIYRAGLRPQPKRGNQLVSTLIGRPRKSPASG